MTHDSTHDAHGHHGDYKADKRAAYVGLVAGAVAIAVLLFGISRMTSAMYAGEKPAAEAGK